MRYVAYGANYTLGIGEPVMALVNGIEIEQKKKRTARFHSGVLLNHEVELGLKAFTFRGLPDGVEPATRLSVFDTRDYQRANRLTDDERIEIEKIIESSPAFGAEFIRVEELSAPKPFPSYDETPVEKLIALVTLTGTDPNVAYRYEAENEAREELLAAFAQMGADDVGVPQELERLSVPEGDPYAGHEFTVSA